MPRMTHPDLPGRPVEATDARVPLLEKSGWVVDEDAAEGHAPDGVLRPKNSALKPAWVDYAVHRGADPAAAEAMTIAELIETYGG